MNKRTIYKIISDFNSILRSFNLTHKSHAGSCRVLNYHSIGGHSLGDSRNMFTTTFEMFKQHIEYLLSLTDIQLIDINNLYIPSDKLKVLITFDDGYIDNYSLVAPYLVEKKIPFTIFIATDYVKNSFKRFMSPFDLLDLSKNPYINIGSHGKSHTRLTNCNNTKLTFELRESKQYLEDLIGKEVKSIAYPYGDYDARVIEYAKNNGYTIGFTTRYDFNTTDRNPLTLSRYNIESDNDIKIIRQKLYGDWDWYRFRHKDHGNS